MPFTALHRLLGLPAGPITDALVEEAVSGGVVETDDLDWKSELPPRSGLKDTDFPKDIAAMANRGGGTLVYGVEEDEKAASGRTDVGEMDENHERTLRAAAASGILPPVMNLTIQRVGDVGKRAVVIVVPATDNTPHLIFNKETFRAPIRNDADTHWMSEGQIAALYRARFDSRRNASEALQDLYSETAANWEVRGHATLIAVARPRLPLTVPSRPTRSSASALVQGAVKISKKLVGGEGLHPLQNMELQNLRAGLRRWVAISKSGADEMRWKSAWAGIHHDGSVSLAASVGGHRTQLNRAIGGHQVQSPAMENAVADFMALIRATSERREISEYDVQVGIEWNDAKPLSINIYNSQGDHKGADFPVNKFSLVRATVVADAPHNDFLWQVQELAEDCVNQGGHSELQLILTPEPRDV